jgi:hypothetical protein
MKTKDSLKPELVKYPTNMIREDAKSPLTTPELTQLHAESPKIRLILPFPKLQV